MVQENIEISERSMTNRLIFSIPILIGILILLYPGDISTRFSGASKIVFGVMLVIVGFGGIIYFSLSQKIVIKTDEFEFWQGKKLKFRSRYDQIKAIECKKEMSNLGKIPVPDKCMNIYTTKGGLFLSTNRHLSKKSLMTFLRKIEEKSFQHGEIKIMDRLNWLYQ